MDFLNIAKTVGAGLFSAVVPGGAAIISAVNASLPDEYKLSDNATGNQIAEQVEKLSPELKAKVALKKFDVDITRIKQEHATAQAMLIADATNPQSTRPKIAYQSFVVVSVISLMFAFALVYAVLIRDHELLKVLGQSWGYSIALVAPFVAWLNRYFGILRDENRDKLNASNGGVAGKPGLIESLGKLIGKNK